MFHFGGSLFSFPLLNAALFFAPPHCSQILICALRRLLTPLPHQPLSVEANPDETITPKGLRIHYRLQDDRMLAGAPENEQISRLGAALLPGAVPCVLQRGIAHVNAFFRNVHVSPVVWSGWAT